MSNTGALITQGTLEVGGKTRDVITLDMTEKSMVKAMEEISQKEIQDFTSSMEVIKTDDILSLISSLFDFMGFDPRAIIKKLLIVNDYYINVKKIKDESRETLKTDVIMMICANVVMGNLQNKSIGRRSATGRLALGYLKSKYKMTTGSTGAGRPSDDLTFPRVANSFPVLTCRAAMVLKPKSFPGAPFSTSNLPWFMRVSAFASLCDEKLADRTRTFLLEAVCAYSCDQLIVVHEGEKKKRKVKKTEDVMSPQDAYGNQWDYILVASTSPVPDQKMKRSMIAELLVENYYSDISEIVKTFRDLLKISSSLPTEEEFKSDLTAFTTG